MNPYISNRYTITQQSKQPSTLYNSNSSNLLELNLNWYYKIYFFKKSVIAKHTGSLMKPTHTLAQLLSTMFTLCTKNFFLSRDLCPLSMSRIDFLHPSPGTHYGHSSNESVQPNALPGVPPPSHVESLSERQLARVE